ncbi:guanine nucleotide-binding protein subunit gamma 1-like [Camellia sinensis]|uniref:guanine nucleotide-binding protein subunit gamma 1-like n=1 Tax=Camellia sinensis TaxID=4442 RepID=UPI00103657AC|nr:guanine nucleotide-binding protein subunit gamma 1-like [Camellia sinensis]
MDSSGGDDDDQQQQSPQLLSSGGAEEKIMMMNEGSPTSTPISAPPPPPKAETPNFIGKHRMAAALAHLQHQIQIIQEELEELETCGESSLVCKELVSTVESLPDALLSVTKGPAVVGWDRWFHGAHGSRGRKRWI